MFIYPGDPSIDWGNFEPFTDKKVVQILNDDDINDVGFLEEEIDQGKKHSKNIYIRTQLLSSETIGNRKGISEVYADSFHPISSREISDNAETAIVYESEKVVGKKIIKSGENEEIDHALDKPVFDSHSIELVFRLLPMAEDYSVKLPIFHSARNKEMTVKIDVVNSESLSTNRGVFDCWIIRSVWDDITQMYWISKGNKEIIKQQTIISEDTSLLFVAI
jgi:hypothetical protein